jgi:TolA-binding protein
VQGYTRRQLKEDKLATTTKEAAAWAAGHKNPVVWGIVIAVVVVLGVIGFMAWRGQQIDQGNLALGAALRTYGQPLSPAGTAAAPGTTNFFTVAERAKASQKEFKAIADKYSMVGPGRMARYMEGVSAMQAGDNAAAEQALNAASSSGDKELSSLAKVSLAQLYRSTNRTADASKLFKELADHPTDTVPKVRAQLDLAEMYESSAPEQAVAIYQQIQKENPKTAAAQIAAAKLSGGKQGPGAMNF